MRATEGTLPLNVPTAQQQMQAGVTHPGGRRPSPHPWPATASYEIETDQSALLGCALVFK